MIDTCEAKTMPLSNSAGLRHKSGNSSYLAVGSWTHGATLCASFGDKKLRAVNLATNWPFTAAELQVCATLADRLFLHRGEFTEKARGGLGSYRRYRVLQGGRASEAIGKGQLRCACDHDQGRDGVCEATNVSDPVEQSRCHRHF